jgi:RNA polymerase sigma factor (sigma-70 family)
MAMSAPAVSLPAPDDSLIAGLRAGDRGAVSRAYEAHHAVIRSFAQRLVGDPGAAEDIVHDTFVALPRAISSFRGDASLRTFLIGVAVNHAKRHVRSAVRRRAAMSRLAEDPGSSPAAVRDPEQEAARRQLADRLWKARRPATRSARRARPLRGRAAHVDRGRRHRRRPRGHGAYTPLSRQAQDARGARGGGLTWAPDATNR